MKWLEGKKTNIAAGGAWLASLFLSSALRAFVNLAALAFGGGAGFYLAGEVIDLLKTQPGLLQMSGWPATVAVICLGMLFVGNYRAGQFIAEQRRATHALESQAAAMAGVTSGFEKLASQNQQRAEVVEGAIGFVAQTVEKMQARQIEDRKVLVALAEKLGVQL